MKKFKSFFWRFLEIIFPVIANWKKNKIVQKNLEMERGELDEVENKDDVKLEDLKEMYDDTFRRKDKIEDKAKTNILSVSISITLIMGASGLLSDVKSKFVGHAWIAWTVFILFIIAVIYMLSAGILVIKMLTNENSMEHILITSLANGGEELRNEYSICIKKNNYRNFIRNNYVFTSYECIRNALFCLFVVLIVIIIPI